MLRGSANLLPEQEIISARNTPTNQRTVFSMGNKIKFVTLQTNKGLHQADFVGL